MSLAMFKDLCIDATDAATLGGFWSAALGLELHQRAGGGVVLRGTSEAHTLWVNQVPEPKTVKHRIHLDVYCSAAGDLQAIGPRSLMTHLEVPRFDGHRV